MRQLHLCPWLVLWCCAAAEAASCPTLKLKEDFSINKYMGVWYMIQEEDSIFQTIKSCSSATYRLEGKNIQVNAQGLDSTGAPTTKQLILKTDPNNPAHMVSDFGIGVEPPFDIVDTDYETFSCAHSCLSIMGIKTEFVFIFSRNRMLDDKNIEHCHRIFESYGIKTSGLVPLPQKDCHCHSDL